MSKIIFAVFILAVLGIFGGCSKTIHEEKSTDTDPGSITQVKFTGSNLKVVSDF